MCGIVGELNYSGVEPNTVERMASTLTHRGPDSGGIWVCNDSTIALGHRRLSILDLSVTGAQPMMSNCRRFVTSFNGEIYNHLNLRVRLNNGSKTIPWSGTSDTETLLRAWQEWGLEKTLNQINGMFAFAMWDRKTKSLVLVRDRIGEKPLYYGKIKNAFVFSSEIRSFNACVNFNSEIDRRAISLQMSLGYIPAPNSIYKNIYKLLPGTYIIIKRANNKVLISAPKEYWSLNKIYQLGKRNQFLGGRSHAVKKLDSIISKSVKQKLISDVPLGAFLSGGIDSSLIVALMAKESDKRVKTFTIGFENKNYNEAPFAKSVSQFIDTDHTELYVSENDVINAIPQLKYIYDEPFSDVSQIPTFLVSKLAKKHVTVALSGDGGDELFYGYNHYKYAKKLYKYINLIPPFMRKWLQSIFSKSDYIIISMIESIILKLKSENANLINISDKLFKVSQLFNSLDKGQLYIKLLSNWHNTNNLIIDQNINTESIMYDSFSKIHSRSFDDQMMLFDSTFYLPDDILVKVDRAAMGNSLETRIPLLDHKVIEFAWQLPTNYKIHNGQYKWILRKVLSNYIPERKFNRPKMGFGVPIASWLRGPLRDWSEDLLSVNKLSQDGWLNPKPIRKKWAEHLSGKRDWKYAIWNVLMFQSWLEANKH